MNKEEIRMNLNKFLKMYFDSCKEIYREINFEKITSTQFKYLKEIYKRERVTTTELAELLQLSKPTITEFIQKFIDSNIVKRTQSEDDKRVFYLTLTDIGKTLATTNTLESIRMVENMEKILTKEELETLSTIFKKFGEG
ncbi:MAG: MarR family winged helix-turn-helix transcriptional regulator [Candidatus Izemoplasmataceae bacterium]